jgi:rubrerythrin
MAFTYNADEIFEMALQIERNGVDFYCRAAGKTDDPDHRRCSPILRIWSAATR